MQDDSCLDLILVISEIKHYRLQAPQNMSVTDKASLLSKIGFMLVLAGATEGFPCCLKHPLPDTDADTGLRNSLMNVQKAVGPSGIQSTGRCVL